MSRHDDSHFSPAAPIAKVTLRSPKSNASLTDVPILIDSGADVTLLPQASVDFLGIEASADEAYQLAGFDGSISISQAVHVDLIFGRQTFKGRFLLIEQAWGILGRDVLNHLCLLLDGPQQVWEER
ncbi:MAG TPA: retropepsin-like aspartic protease [Chthonomonadaceae bacterium]|nr:retropepsin-like aspartic protease [Chthonomonadaceae bacterium]